MVFPNQKKFVPEKISTLKKVFLADAPGQSIGHVVQRKYRQLSSWADWIGGSAAGGTFWHVLCASKNMKLRSWDGQSGRGEMFMGI
jgi:hypothetical protein